jgi:translation initiation factor IF-3
MITNKTNLYIKSNTIRLLDIDKTQLGIYITGEAKNLATERGLDLIEISANAEPPVYMLGDINKYYYEQKKKQKEQDKKNRKLAKATEEKEIQLSPNIGDGDFKTKLNQTNEFLSKGHKVKFVVKFTGREMSHANDSFPRIIEKIKASIINGEQVGYPEKNDRRWIIVYQPKKD